MSTVYREVSRGEFLRRYFEAADRTAHGGPSFSCVAVPLAEGGATFALRDDRGEIRLTETEADIDGARVGRIDQDAAIEILAACADFLLANPDDRRTRKLRHKILFEQMPVGFHWVATPDGRHLIRAYNAAYSQPWPPGEWRELAAHPNEYGDIWRIGERTPEDQDRFGGGSLYFGGPPSLQRWAQFETTDARLWAERAASGGGNP